MKAEANDRMNANHQQLHRLLPAIVRTTSSAFSLCPYENASGHLAMHLYD